MKTWKLSIAVAALSLAAGATLDVARAQTSVTAAGSNGGHISVWDVVTPGTSSCPALDIHIVANGDRITGTAAAGDMLDISRVSGMGQADGSFSLTVKPTQEKGPSGTITGTVDMANQMVKATLTGFGCHDGTGQARYTGPAWPYNGG